MTFPGFLQNFPKSRSSAAEVESSVQGHLFMPVVCSMCLKTIHFIFYLLAQLDLDKKNSFHLWILVLVSRIIFILVIKMNLCQRRVNKLYLLQLWFFLSNQFMQNIYFHDRHWWWRAISHCGWTRHIRKACHTGSIGNWMLIFSVKSGFFFPHY